MTNFNAKLMEVVQADPRFAYEAYEFVFHGLAFTQKMLGREPVPIDPACEGQHHVTGQQLLEGLRLLAQREFGLMAPTVFRIWGILRTDDFGDIVFNLIEAGLMSKNSDDCRADFCGVFDIDEALLDGFRISLDETLEA